MGAARQLDLHVGGTPPRATVAPRPRLLSAVALCSAPAAPSAVGERWERAAVMAELGVSDGALALRAGRAKQDVRRMRLGYARIPDEDVRGWGRVGVLFAERWSARAAGQQGSGK